MPHSAKNKRILQESKNVRKLEVVILEKNIGFEKYAHLVVEIKAGTCNTTIILRE